MNIKQITEDKDLRDTFQIRKVILVEEQGVPLEDEFDQYDSEAIHILVFHEDQPSATGRLRILSDCAKLERICVLANFRQYGLGKAVVQSLEKITKEKGLRKAKLHAQTQASGFYKKLGYTPDSKEFMEDGIPHILMVKNLSEG